MSVVDQARYFAVRRAQEPMRLALNTISGRSASSLPRMPRSATVIAARAFSTLKRPDIGSAAVPAQVGACTVNMTMPWWGDFCPAQMVALESVVEKVKTFSAHAP